ncbi:LysR family transcriptional regulator [Curvibacter sp. CHRR-16]|uniref:LysR family transcriptional regulator n=1 Tax=Curvibacter sp. CHRR-16 TaxID=2835872 RepID=UPI001BDA1679|nr:LysR family transcriptional regulator [Curvibacter sp. CHRR-16]MBT0569110.1 LysR family transcriptional regulator [Curvibacter sp. CHRR-16]
MRDQELFDKIDLHLIRLLHTVLTERSVSRAAIKLGMHQPAVSAALKRLRMLADDQLLVRSGSGMVPTVTGLRMIEPSASILRAAEMLFTDVRGFAPTTARTTFRIAASDYLDPLFLPTLVARVKEQAPMAHLEIHPLYASVDYRHQLAQGEIDVVIGNWPKPPDDLHMGRLLGDEVVCLVSKNHPAVRRGWDQDAWLKAEHVAPVPYYPGSLGMIDEHLEGLGLQRNITVRTPYFALIPSMVASTLLVLTTGRQYCERFVQRNGLVILPSPVEFPRMMYYQLWHKRSHTSAASRWLRDCIKTVAGDLKKLPEGSL